MGVKERWYTSLLKADDLSEALIELFTTSPRIRRSLRGLRSLRTLIQGVLKVVRGLRILAAV